MSAVGAFPNMRELNRRPIRGPENPLDKSTIVSIYPREVKIRNFTLSPGTWVFPAGSVETPSVTVIGSSSWYKDVGPDEPLIEIPQSSVQIADSLVKDYCNGMFACDMVDSMPGMFFVPGAFAIQEIKTKYKNLLEQALVKQTNYYRTLLKYADSLWARSNGNPLTINDEMRLAAKTLGMQDKDWMKDHQNAGQVRCFACGSFKNPEFPICSACRTIDPEHPKAKLIKTAAE